MVKVVSALLGTRVMAAVPSGTVMMVVAASAAVSAAVDTVLLTVVPGMAAPPLAR